MTTANVTTVEQYLASLPADRRATIAAVRDVVNRHLPDGYRESMAYGMIGWGIPLARFAATYNKQPLGLAALAAQKGHCALYLMGVYGDAGLERWFRDAFAKAGKKLDMGKSCVRFRTVEDLPLDVIGQTIAKVSPEELIARHEEAHGKAAKAARAGVRAKAAAGATTTKAAAKRPAATKKPAAATTKKAAATKTR